MKSNVKVFKNKKKIENFDLMIDEICDFDIVHKKFIDMYSLYKSVLRNLSYLYNNLVNKGKDLNSLKDYISKTKDIMSNYTDLINMMEKSVTFDKEARLSIEKSFKLFLKSYVVESMMYTYSSLKLYDLENEDWIILSKSKICPLKDCEFNLYSIYSINKEEINNRMKKIKVSVESFYSIYILPNFNMDKSIESICEYLMDLHKTGQVKCNLIPTYIRKVYSTGLIDMNELNELYLESNNRNMFVVELFDKFFNSDVEEIVLDAKTSFQIKKLLAFLQNAKGSEKIAGTFNIGNSLLDSLRQED